MERWVGALYLRAFVDLTHLLRAQVEGVVVAWLRTVLCTASREEDAVATATATALATPTTTTTTTHTAGVERSPFTPLRVPAAQASTKTLSTTVLIAEGRVDPMLLRARARAKQEQEFKHWTERLAFYLYESFGQMR